MQKFSYLTASNIDYIDDLYQRYLSDPNSIESSWRFFFEGIELGTSFAPAQAASLPNGNGKAGASGLVATPTSAVGIDWLGEVKVAQLIQAYREQGKFLAHLDPLSAAPSSHPDFELSRFGLSNADLTKSFHAGKLIGLGPSKLSDILARLRSVYCGTIGFELTHIQNRAAREWLQNQVESLQGREALDTETRKLILNRLTEAEGFERFLHTRYVAQKRFSVEGGESTLPALDCIIETCADLGAKEFVIGMAHRGRLNVLVHTMGKAHKMIFTEFEGTYKPDFSYEGDVKYHKGYSHDMTTRRGKKVHLSLASNPSHLEFVNPVIEGMARSKQDHMGDPTGEQVVPIQIHGDAAFAGQGVCYETLNLSQLRGYRTGGSLHIVINNQVGFTTSPADARSTLYSTDLARMMDSPIFHVNGDDPEAVWFVSKLASEYRQKFKADAFIDIICYRKHGHNEGDEPSFTQPLLYKKIKTHPSTREQYAQKLVQLNVLKEGEPQALVDQFTARMMEAQAQAKTENPQPHVSTFEGLWKGLKRPDDSDIFAPVNTAVDAKKLLSIAERINQVPAGFHIHPKLTRFFEARLKAVQEGKGIDWGNGETLAYATLISEGIPVRLTGQDAERGTFTHRHSVLNDFESGQKFAPLNQVATDKARFSVYNSHLSETGVMGFEYGYSLANPLALVIWEAQFGDFANGAQVIIDQFIATSETKWLRMNGLVLLLPHGYEGQGPEHSSARLERFLNLCGKNNMFVCYFTTPAQIFHALRRHVKREFRKPMVIMSPKSLLRHPQAVSEIGEFTQGGFQEVLDDPTLGSKADAEKVERVLLCTGKVYYDLSSERLARKKSDIAIVRLEQLYPFPAAKLAQVLARYKNAKELVWVQEEPRNMGAWQYIFMQWSGGLNFFQKEAGNRPIRYAGRDIAAAPAVGSIKVHEHEHKALIESALS